MKKFLTIMLAAVLLAAFAIAVNAAVGTVIYAPKTSAKPNMEEIDASWGEPAIHVTKDTENANLTRYWDMYPNHTYSFVKGEEVEFDLYVLWTDKNLYIGMKSKDNDITGASQTDCGDGMEFWLQPLDAMIQNGLANDGLYTRLAQGQVEGDVDNNLYDSLVPTACFCVTLDFDDYSVSNGALGKYTTFGSTECEKYINQTEDEIQAMIEIPIINLGIKPANAAGSELGIAFLRMALTAEGAAYTSTPRASWLEWGKYYKNAAPGKSVNKTVNTIILSDGSTPVDTTPADTTDTEDTTVEVTPNLDGVSSWALAEVEAGIKEGLVPENLQANYTSPVTRGAVAQMFVILLEKSAGKSIDDIMAENGVAINEGAFTDTTDKAVLAANALGIIN
ncbi:MAG: hypothetical protein IJU57_02110, partial [Clostridia bacterium]|nr:hypothetical protein [Clostridia bacterium]